MLKKILFFLIINIIILLSIEIIIKTTLKVLNYPTVYKLGNIPEKNYDYLTGYYNLPNIEERSKGNYYQGTDQYGFNLDGERFVTQDLTKKDDNTFRIFLLGGSTIKGAALVDRYDPISARLEKKLNKKMGNSKLTFQVINAGTTSFISSQELALTQYKILYALKPDYIIILNGTNDATSYLGNQFYLSNSHYYQRGFQKNISKTSKNFFFYFDDWASKNLSSYFLLKKLIEKTTNNLMFDAEERKFRSEEMSEDMTEKRIYRYFYNINLISKLANKDTYVSLFFQPQMLPENINGLSNNDQKILNNFNKKDKYYFSNKTLFYNKAREKIKSFNSSDESKDRKFFQIVDISNILDFTSDSKDYYSDRVHYTSISREIIVKRIFQDIEKKIKENLSD